MIQPFTARDLRQRCIADVIFDLTGLTMLYPNKPKDELKMFMEFTTTVVSNSSGYVNEILVRGRKRKRQSTTIGTPRIEKLTTTLKRVKLDNHQDEEM